jgi:polyferredoxin
MSAAIAEPAPAKPGKKTWKRAGRDYSQVLRRTIQMVFLALNAWICVQFYLFVRYYETGGATLWTSRPSGVEGWLPIASLMNLKVLFATGAMPRLHPAGMFLLLAFIGMSWLFRKSFCSWLCPVGTLSEALWKLGRSTFRRNFRLPRRLDVGLRGVKYILLGLFVYAVASMSVKAIRAFLEGPYGIVADVKMLNFFRLLSFSGGVVLAVLVLASVLVRNFWCRYLCPYGALMGLGALASPLRIRRDPSACIDCGKCANACPSVLPVDRLITIQSAECTGCMECVAACPAAGALMMAAPGRKRVPAWAIAAGVAIIFLGFTGYARISGNWRTDLPGTVYEQLIPHANEFEHP